MKAKQRQKLTRKAASVPHIKVIQFDNRMEELIAGATAVVAMGGYNTFCEILSFDKRALIVPRVEPRQEQLIRARRAAELGLVDMLLPSQSADPLQLAAALKALPARLPPSQAAGALTLDGLTHICDIVGSWLNVATADRMSRVAG
jgi:predicted glycosyltransferase